MANGQVASYRQRSLAGPIVLIVIGGVFLLRNMGYPIPIMHWFAQYWPVLIILWGVIKLVEYVMARQAGRPAPGIGAGGYFLLFFLIMFGLAVSQSRRVDWDQLRSGGIDIDGEFIGLLGTRYEYPGQTLQADLPAGAGVRVHSERGNVRVVPGAEGQVQVVVNKRVFAGSQSEADRIAGETEPTLRLENGVLHVDASRSRGATLDMELHVPPAAALEIMSLRGDVDVNDRGAGVKINASRGSVRLQGINGSAAVHLRRGDFTASNVTGDVAIEGRVQDATVNNVGGEARLAGDFFGSIRVTRVGKTVTFKSSRTDMEMARLDGELHMEGSRTNMRNVEGPVRLLTRSKEIRIEDFTGDLMLENSNGGVRVQPAATVGNMRIENRRGNIELVLPAQASFQIDARVRRGEIRSEFPGLDVDTSGAEARATGSVGTGKARVQVNNESGRLDIRRTSS